LAGRDTRRGSREAGSPAGFGADGGGVVVVVVVVVIKTWAKEGLGGRETFGEEHWTPFGDVDKVSRWRVSMEKIFFSKWAS
jgi:hypothetical protein